MFRLGTLVAIVLALAAIPVSAGATPPAPCHNAPQITDASGDGHHDGTDVLAAWWSEAAGRLQVVIGVRSGVWIAQHDDAQINGSGFIAFFFNGNRTSFLRARTPAADRPGDPVLYDYGAVSVEGQLLPEGTMAGVTEAGSGGTVTMDVPAGLAPAGAKLTSFFVTTYDGIDDGVPTPVDHAPGGEQPNDPARGADYIVGSCNAAAITTTAVGITAPAKVTGRKTVTVSGRLTPARGGVAVAIARAANQQTTTTTVTSTADGSFSAKLAIAETTRLKATAEGIGSTELTVTAHTKVRIKVSNRKDGSAVVTGTVDPKLPGRVQWLRSNAITPSARVNTRNGSFRLRLKHPRPGRYQAVVIPTGGRAERATSNTGVIK